MPLKRRLYYAVLCFAILGGLAVYLLRGVALYAVLVLLGGLALKTVIAYKAGWSREDRGE